MVTEWSRPERLAGPHQLAQPTNNAHTGVRRAVDDQFLDIDDLSAYLRIPKATDC
jgi:hypothetical protein